MIPAGFLQDLLGRVDIVDVVGRHVQLRRGGANLMGLCPFHNEKSPSFSVSPSKQFFHCFGCGASGDAIRFLTEHLGLSFVEAVEELAQEVGLQVPQEQVSAQERVRRDTLRERRKSLNEVLAQACAFYRKQLKAHPRAVSYLKQRGLSGVVAARYGLGFAPPGWRSLAGVFERYDDPILEESGLVRQRTADEPKQRDEAVSAADHGRYDWFRDRIMFPIRAVSGDVIGFGGRVLDDSKPKYINSPETPLFSKGRELYGLFEGRAAIRHRGYALVVEGYMDVVALAQVGFENAVATLGTACTSDHIQKLFRFTDSVVFSFDGDAAGRRAAGRALEACLPHASDTRSVRFLFLPPEHDPDSYVRQLGSAAFEAQVQSSIPLSRQLLEFAKEGCDLQTAEGRSRFLTQAKPLWMALPDGALRRQMIPSLAEQGGVSVADLRSLWSEAGLTLRPSSPESSDPLVSMTTPPVRARALRQPSRHAARNAPLTPAARALRMLLLNSVWWDQLTADDHDLLNHMPRPEGPVFAWLERQIAEHGPQSWAVLKQGLIADEMQTSEDQLVPESALDDDMSFDDLQSTVNLIWLARLEEESRSLSAIVASDPSALVRFREVDAKYKERKERKDRLTRQTKAEG